MTTCDDPIREAAPPRNTGNNSPSNVWNPAFSFEV
jgi:hypothetical protein